MRRLVAAFGLAVLSFVACEAERTPRGQLTLVISTNLAPPKDFDTFRVEISRDGETTPFKVEYLTTGSQPVKFPSTLAIAPLGRPVLSIKVIASRLTADRITREAVVRVPEERNAALPLPLDGLCIDVGCPTVDGKSQTCIAGTCYPAQVEESDLAVFDPSVVFGNGACFDTLGCFSTGEVVATDASGGACRIAKAGGPNFNVGLIVPAKADGICASNGCLIPLDRDPFDGEVVTGWREKDGQVQLPKAVCERSLTVAITTKCPTKTGPTCGPWSAVGGASVGSDGLLPTAGGSGDAGLPSNVPASLTFVDGDVREGFVKGNVVIGRALDESGITGYRLYWADPIKKLDAIATLPKTGADISHPLEGPMLAESSHLRVVSYAANGEIAPDVAAGPIDNFLRQKGINVQGESISVPATLIDAKNQRLLIVGHDIAASRMLPSLVSCKLDGTGCVYRDLTNGEAKGISIYKTGAVIDETNDKLLVVSDWGGSGGNKPTLYRCNRDGTSCDGSKDLGAPTSMASIVRTNVVIDDVNKKFLALFASAPSAGRIARCDLDGNNCSFPTYGAGLIGGQDGDLVIDKVGNKLLVVQAALPNSRPTLFQCDIDGQSCGVKDISVNSGVAASAVTIALDAKNAKLIVVTFVTNSPTLQFYRCNLDGEGCITRTLPNPGIDYPQNPHLVVDTAHEKIFVFTYGSTRGVYERCELDGTGCTFGPTTTTFGMYYPRAALFGGKLFVVGAKNSTGADFATFLAY